VRAMRKGWLKKQDDKPPEKPPVYLLWQDDGLAADHTQAGEPRMPAWGTTIGLGTSTTVARSAATQSAMPVGPLLATRSS